MSDVRAGRLEFLTNLLSSGVQIHMNAKLAGEAKSDDQRYDDLSL